MAKRQTEIKSDLQLDILVPDSVLLDPRRSLFLSGYFMRESPTFGNAYKSAIAAGYSHEYAECITYQRPQWLSEFLGSTDLGSAAEEHLREVLSLSNVQQVIGTFGPMFQTVEVTEDTGDVYKTGPKKGQKKTRKVKKKIPVLKHDTQLIKAKNEVAKLVLPAYKPEIYRQKNNTHVKFTYNVKEVRQRYKPDKK